MGSFEKRMMVEVWTPALEGSKLTTMFVWPPAGMLKAGIVVMRNWELVVPEVRESVWLPVLRIWKVRETAWLDSAAKPKSVLSASRGVMSLSVMTSAKPLPPWTLISGEMASPWRVKLYERSPVPRRCR